MDQIDGWVVQVTRGNPRDGEQAVDMYAVWNESEDEAAAIVKQTFSVPDDDIIASVEALTADYLTAQGLNPGEACVFKGDE